MADWLVSYSFDTFPSEQLYAAGWKSAGVWFVSARPQFLSRRTNVWARDSSHRLSGARSSHIQRICKDFNNEPLTPNHRDRSGVYKGLYICKSHPGPGPYKPRPRSGLTLTSLITSGNHWASSSTVNMVKYFSVEWLAQSHHVNEQTEEHEPDTDSLPTSRPHIPCVVQPCPPTLGKSHLQLKPKATRVSVVPQEITLSPTTHPENCASPSKFEFPKLPLISTGSCRCGLCVNMCC